MSETRQPLSAKPVHPERYDYEYRREGVAHVFMFFAPLHSWRHVKIADRRTNADWAECMRELVDIHLPNAEVVAVVKDQLPTHSPAAFYGFFASGAAILIRDQQHKSRWMCIFG